MSQETKRVFINTGHPYLASHIATGMGMAFDQPADVPTEIPMKPIEIKPPPPIEITQLYVEPVKRSKHHNKASHKRKPKGKKTHRK